MWWRIWSRSSLVSSEPDYNLPTRISSDFSTPLIGRLVSLLLEESSFVFNLAFSRNLESASLWRLLFCSNAAKSFEIEFVLLFVGGQEPWIMGLMAFHALFLLVTLLSRRRLNFHMFLFLFACKFPSKYWQPLWPYSSLRCWKFTGL